MTSDIVAILVLCFGTGIVVLSFFVSGENGDLLRIAGWLLVLVGWLLFGVDWKSRRKKKEMKKMKVKMLKVVKFDRFTLSEKPDGSWCLCSEDSSLRSVTLNSLAEVKALTDLLLEAVKDPEPK